MDVETETTSLTQTDCCQQACLKAAARSAYSQQKAPIVDDDLVTQFLPMVHKIVQRAVTYLKPPLSREDLVSAGLIGLLKAAGSYDPSHEAEFQTYAYIRIKGAVLDELKSQSFVPAAVNKQICQVEKLRLEITEQTGMTPTDEELAQTLQIPMDKLYRIFENARAKRFVSLDSPDDSFTPGHAALSDDTCDPSYRMEQAELTEQLAEAIGMLNEKERQVIILYYQQELTMRQIAEVFGLTEPRVSQLHAKALFSLSMKMREWKHGRE